jgi:antitoxin MazE
METKIQKWGNSFGVRIPRALLDGLSLVGDDTVVLSVEKGILSLTKKKQEKYTLAGLLKGVTPKKYNRDYIDLGDEIGNEKVVW